MKKFFLDSNILIHYPEILSYKRNDATLIIPDVVIKELQGARIKSLEDISNLIQNSEAKGYVSILSIPPLPPYIPGDAIWSVVDTSIILYLRSILTTTDNSEIIFVTNDNRAASEAKFAKVAVWNAQELIEFYKTPGSVADKEIKKEAIQVENKVRWGILSNLLLAIIILTVFVLLARYYGDVVDQLKNATIIIILVIFGFLLFEVREKRRQLYGFTEIGFGILTIVVVFYPNIILNNWDKFLKIAAGLYIIVRGLDNLYKGSENRQIGSLLRRLFRFNR